MRASELTGALLDYWVARAEGLNCTIICGIAYARIGAQPPAVYAPSSIRQHAGPLTDKYALTTRGGINEAIVQPTGCTYIGEDVRAYERLRIEFLPGFCRAIVRTKFGDTVEDMPA